MVEILIFCQTVAEMVQNLLTLFHNYGQEKLLKNSIQFYQIEISIK